jgi:hypothetical protein
MNLIEEMPAGEYVAYTPAEDPREWAVSSDENGDPVYDEGVVVEHLNVESW